MFTAFMQLHTCQGFYMISFFIKYRSRKSINRLPKVSKTGYSHNIPITNFSPSPPHLILLRAPPNHPSARTTALQCATHSRARMVGKHIATISNLCNNKCGAPLTSWGQNGACNDTQMALQKSAMLKTINVNHCRLLKFDMRSILNADGPPRR